MGMGITALAPARRPSSGMYLAKPKETTGVLLIQSLIEAIEGLKGALAVQGRSQPPVRSVPSVSESVELMEPQSVQVQRIEPAEPYAGQTTVKRNWMLEFFD